MDELHQILRAAVARLPLADGWSPDTAADWAWSRIQPTTWQHLVAERGWSAERYTDHTVGSLVCELSSDPPILAANHRRMHGHPPIGRAPK